MFNVSVVGGQCPSWQEHVDTGIAQTAHQVSWQTFAVVINIEWA